MPLNPLAPVTDYQTMLNRIAWFTTAAALGAIWLLRLNVAAIEAQLSKIDFALQFGGDKVLRCVAGDASRWDWFAVETVVSRKARRS
jgi:hypothetical protein